MKIEKSKPTNTTHLHPPAYNRYRNLKVEPSPLSSWSLSDSPDEQPVWGSSNLLWGPFADDSGRPCLYNLIPKMSFLSAKKSEDQPLSFDGLCPRQWESEVRAEEAFWASRGEF